MKGSESDGDVVTKAVNVGYVGSTRDCGTKGQGENSRGTFFPFL